MTKRTLLATVVFGALTGLAAAVATAATRRSVDSIWYWRLKKPKFQPPREAFAPVWTGLYGLIAVSGAMVWNAPRGPARTRALALWGAQLALNAGWSTAFFGARRPKVALVDLGALLGTIVGYGVAAHQVDRVAIDGESIKLKQAKKAPLIYVLLNKPRSVYCTNQAQGEQRLAIDLLPRDFPRLYPVGRLDHD